MKEMHLQSCQQNGMSAEIRKPYSSIRSLMHQAQSCWYIHLFCSSDSRYGLGGRESKPCLAQGFPQYDYTEQLAQSM